MSKTNPAIQEIYDGRMLCTNCGKIDSVWGAEYSYDHPERYDGVSEWYCNPLAGGCGIRMGRWSLRTLKDGEYEHRFGKKPPEKRTRKTIPDESV